MGGTGFLMMAVSNYSDPLLPANNASYDNPNPVWTMRLDNSSINATGLSGEKMEDISMADLDPVFRIRFYCYTALAVACVAFNVLSVVAMTKIVGHRTVHHTLLLNLATCDIIGSILLWMYYNSVILFPRFSVTTVWHCLFVMMGLVCPFILSLCSSSLSLLMLALNQYIAICKPLFSTTKVTKGKIICCIVSAWFLSVILAMVPALIMLFLKASNCSRDAGNLAQKSLEICTYALAALIVFIVFLYAGIYKEIVNYRKRTTQLSIRRTRTNGDPETEHNYKAFVTTLLLSGTLVLFWLPYMVYHFLSMYIMLESAPDLFWQVKVYAIDFLPMLNFLTDPIIYGIRMREIRDAYHRLFAKLLPCCVDEPRRPSARASVRFSTLDTTTI